MKRPEYRAPIPLVTRSSLTSKRKGGVGKAFSDGWAINMAVGCPFGCLFCYVHGLNRQATTLPGQFAPETARMVRRSKWGSYFLIASNLAEAIDKTPWEKWKGQEVMLCPAHDPYAKGLEPFTRLILERGLRAGVRFCIQTRLTGVVDDLDVLEKYSRQVRVQFSFVSSSTKLSNAIEPRVPTPRVRLLALERLARKGISTGVVVAPILPPVPMRPNVRVDLDRLARALRRIRPRRIFGEALHPKGQDVAPMEEVLGGLEFPDKFDEDTRRVFHAVLKAHGMKGVWWAEREANPLATGKFGGVVEYVPSAS